MTPRVSFADDGPGKGNIQRLADMGLITLVH